MNRHLSPLSSWWLANTAFVYVVGTLMQKREHDEQGQPIERRLIDLPPNSWLGLVKTILTTSGPLALMALALAGFLGYAVWGRLDHIDLAQTVLINEMNRANMNMSTFVKMHEQIERDRTATLVAELKILRQVCLNSAHTDAQGRGCIAE